MCRAGGEPRGGSGRPAAAVQREPGRDAAAAEQAGCHGTQDQGAGRR